MGEGGQRKRARRRWREGERVAEVVWREGEREMEGEGEREVREGEREMEGGCEEG